MHPLTVATSNGSSGIDPFDYEAMDTEGQYPMTIVYALLVWVSKFILMDLVNVVSA